MCVCVCVRAIVGRRPERTADASPRDELLRDPSPASASMLATHAHTQSRFYAHAHHTPSKPDASRTSEGFGRKGPYCQRHTHTWSTHTLTHSGHSVRGRRDVPQESQRRGNAMTPHVCCKSITASCFAILLSGIWGC